MGLIVVILVLYIIARIVFFALTKGETTRTQQVGFRLSLFAGCFTTSLIWF